MRTSLLVLLILALTPAAAGAATYYASPAGTGEICSQQDPCTLRTLAGIGRDLGGHEVVVLAGVHDLGDAFASLFGGFDDLRIRGEGADRTTIRGRTRDGDGLVVIGPASRIADLRIVQHGGPPKANALLVTSGGPQAVLERLVVESQDFDAIGLGGDAVVRDTVARSQAAGGAAVSVYGRATAGLRNVTAIGTNVGAIADGPSTMGIRNSIVRATAPGGKDLVEKDGGQLAVAFSAFRPDRVTGDVARIGDVHFDGLDPQLDEATGRIARLSPLRDVADQSAVAGTTDVRGRPRTLGPKADVGAFELLVQPALGPLTASSVGPDRATLKAFVDPLGGPVRARIEAAGRTIDLGIVDVRREVTTELTGLPPGSAHEARLVTTDGDGDLAGAPISFSTPATPAPPPPPPTKPAAIAPAPAFTAALARARLRRGARTTLTVTTTAAGRLDQVVERLLPGRRRGRACVARARQGRPCTRRVVVTRARRTLAAGRTVLTFRARRGRRALPAGRYVVRLALGGRTVALPFRVVR